MRLKKEVRFPAEGGIELSAWLFVPERKAAARLPAVTMAHGYGGTKYHGVEPMAEAFAEAGFAVLLHDHRGFGDSGALGLGAHALNGFLSRVSLNQHGDAVAVVLLADLGDGEAAGRALSEAAWKTKPSWYLVATDDRMIPHPAQRFMSKRADQALSAVAEHSHHQLCVVERATLSERTA